MAKSDKQPKEKAAPAKAKADGPVRFVFDPNSLQKIIGQLRKLMGNTENLELFFDGTQVQCHIETAKGQLTLIDNDSVKEGVGSFSFKVPIAMWQSATKGRSSLTLTKGTGDKKNYIVLTGPRYNTELHYSDGDNTFTVVLDKGVSADPILELVTNCGSYLTLQNYIDGVPLDVNMRWTKENLTACQISTYHAIICEGPITKTQPGELNLPQDVFFNLTELGGAIGFSGKNIAVTSDKGFAALSQIDAETALITLDQAVSLIHSKLPGSFVVNGPEFWTLLDNAMEVSEWGNFLTLELDTKGKTPSLNLSTAGRFGNVTGSTEIHEVTGKLPPRINVTPQAVAQMGPLFTGNVRISVNDKIITLAKTENKHEGWVVTGFVSLTSDE